MRVRARVLTNLVSHSYVNKARGIFTRCSVSGSSETGSPSRCVCLLVCGDFWYETLCVKEEDSVHWSSLDTGADDATTTVELHV